MLALPGHFIEVEKRSHGLLVITLELVIGVTVAGISHGVSVKLVKPACNALLNGHLDSACLVSDGSLARVSNNMVIMVFSYLPLRSG